jgi:predicted DNA-binding transcriptional regulator YafY
MTKKKPPKKPLPRNNRFVDEPKHTDMIKQSLQNTGMAFKRSAVRSRSAPPVKTKKVRHFCLAFFVFKRISACYTDFFGGYMGEQILLERFLWFDQQLRQRLYPNAAHLAERFEFSAKTAQRSIEYFRDRLQAPLEYDALHRGYFYRADFELPAARISAGELAALLISRRLLCDASAGNLEGELASVVNKLGGIISSHLPGTLAPDEAFSFRWSQFVPTKNDDFQRVCQALLGARILSFDYQSPARTGIVRRSVEPHHLVNYLGTWHLIAYCRLRHDWRDFVLPRMAALVVERDEFSYRPRADWKPLLTDTFGIFQNRHSFTVALRFTPERSRLVQGQVWHPDQQVAYDEAGALLLTLPASHPAEILMSILSHGAEVEVLAPDWLRSQVAKEIKRMGQRYAGQRE